MNDSFINKHEKKAGKRRKKEGKRRKICGYSFESHSCIGLFRKTSTLLGMMLLKFKVARNEQKNERSSQDLENLECLEYLEELEEIKYLEYLEHLEYTRIQE